MLIEFVLIFCREDIEPKICTKNHREESGASVSENNEHRVSRGTKWSETKARRYGAGATTAN